MIPEHLIGEDHWFLLSEETFDLLEKVRARSGIVTAEATLDWLVRHMAEHYQRIDRANAQDAEEGPVPA
jgi:hypothetical protein